MDYLAAALDIPRRWSSVFRDLRHQHVYYPPSVDPDEVDQIQLPKVFSLAGNQTMQSDLPEVTKALWRWAARKFPYVAGLGSWGDRSHQARRSDHNYTTSSGKRGPRALDIMTNKPSEHDAIVAALLKDREVLGLSLIISRRRKRSPHTNWEPRMYFGISAHTDHVHASCDGTPSGSFPKPAPAPHPAPAPKPAPVPPKPAPRPSITLWRDAKTGSIYQPVGLLVADTGYHLSPAQYADLQKKYVVSLISHVPKRTAAKQ